MTATQQLVDERPIHRFEYDDGSVVLAVDVGPDADASVDVVDGTAIVVVGADQYDVELPEGDPQAFIRNGVLTIEVTRNPEARQE